MTDITLSDYIQDTEALETDYNANLAAIATVVNGDLTAANFTAEAGITWSQLGNRPSCRVRKTAAQTITTGTETAVTFDAERFDTDTMHSTSVNTSRITMTTVGRYLIFASMRFSASGAVTYDCSLTLRVNGTTEIASEAQERNIAADQDEVRYISVLTLYDFAAAQYVECMVWHNAGSNRTIDVDSSFSPEFGAVRVSA